MIDTMIVLVLCGLGVVLGTGYVVIGLAFLDALDIDRDNTGAIAVVACWPLIGIYLLAVRFITRS